jgi:integrase
MTKDHVKIMIRPTRKTFHKSLRENLNIIVCRLSNIVDGSSIDNTITLLVETIVRKRSLAGKQAKMLSPAQIRTALSYLTETRNAERDVAMFLFSVRAGLRAGEIAGATWTMVLGSDGRISDTLALEDRVAKMGSGRTIPLAHDLKFALECLHAKRNPAPSEPIIYSERRAGLDAATVAQRFFHLYARLGFVGCSSHSGRRTFLTNCARKISLVGGSLRDVQMLAGHADLTTTSAYIEADPEAARKVVNLI